jgi:tRNA-dependent cyclodipeptide synthase
LSAYGSLINRVKSFNEGIKQEHWAIEIGTPPKSNLAIKNGVEMLHARAPMLLPICLNNGYYTRRRIRHLITFASHFAPQVTIFFTDGRSVHNYLAWGSSREEAIRKARKQKKRLQNACIEAIDSVRSSGAFNVSFIDWADIYQRCAYKTQYASLQILFNTNNKFRADVSYETEHVLRTHTRVSDAALTIATRYPLEELAFLLSYKTMAGEFTGVASADTHFVYIYHQHWPLLENVVNGKYDPLTRTAFGFAIVNIVDI